MWVSTKQLQFLSWDRGKDGNLKSLWYFLPNK